MTCGSAGRRVTVEFGCDSQQVRLRVSAAEASELRLLLLRYIARARRVGAVRDVMSLPAAQRDENRRIREWAAGCGDVTLRQRGRIPTAVRQRYYAMLTAGTDEANDGADAGVGDPGLGEESTLPC